MLQGPTIPGRRRGTRRGYTRRMATTRVQNDVRAARGGDAQAVVELLASIYREDRWFVGDGPPSAAVLGRRIRSEDPGDALFLVATDEGGVVGWLELQRLLADKMRHVAVLTLAVGASHRRRGIGTALLREAYEWARRCRVLKISLNVRANNDGAIALYEREGFVREGLEARHVRTATGFEDNLIMARFLDVETGGDAPGSHVD